MFEQGLKFVTTGEDQGAGRMAKDLDNQFQKLKNTFNELGSTGIDRFTGQFVNAAGEILSKTEALNAVGVQNTQQVVEQIRVYSALIKAHENDAVAVTQLESAVNSLIGRYGLANRGLSEAEALQARLAQRNIQTTAVIGS